MDFGRFSYYLFNTYIYLSYIGLGSGFTLSYSSGSINLTTLYRMSKYVYYEIFINKPHTILFLYPYLKVIANSILHSDDDRRRTVFK